MGAGNEAEVIGNSQDAENVPDAAARPFVKWAGGKTQLLKSLHRYAPRQYSRYWEPFLGGGAFLFSLGATSSIVSDTNEELISTYKVVRDDVEALICELRTHTYDKEHYYHVRSWDRREDFQRMSAVSRAARFIYLNKSCFNGLYRVNSKGHFNVPFGKYTNLKIVDSDNLRRCSAALQSADIRLGSYLAIESGVQEGDFVYFDPPYVPLNSSSSFTSYTKEGFGIEDQVGLRDLCVRLADKGAFVMVSNSAATVVEELYKGFEINRVQASRAINSKVENRGAIEELIITSYHE